MNSAFDEDKSSSDTSFIKKWKQNKLDKSGGKYGIQSNESSPQDVTLPIIQTQPTDSRETTVSLTYTARDSIDLRKSKLC